MSKVFVKRKEVKSSFDPLPETADCDLNNNEAGRAHGAHALRCVWQQQWRRPNPMG
ncbi:MAG: hypothetical protein IPM46_09780 [Flavobacteriales bacterium]|nr:hypothetical protein [Flavobacteriales bacterium]